jgi:putative methyltransferase (TIGR04325 family)
MRYRSFLVNAKARAYLKDILPPLFIRLITRRRAVTWSGNYDSWKIAAAASTGYGNPVILEKVKRASLKVKAGLAAYERDSVVFYKKGYRWPVLAILLRIAAKQGDRLRVIDIGGSLGSLYFQHRNFLDHLSELRWNIVEQSTFVSCGKRCFETEELRFFESLEGCLKDHPAEVALMSSVLPYVEDPFALLEEVFSYRIPYIIVDRTPFLLEGTRDRLTVQKIPANIYSASYPAWFFNKERFFRFVGQKYRVVTIFDCEDKANIPCEYKGLFLEELNARP